MWLIWGKEDNYVIDNKKLVNTHDPYLTTWDWPFIFLNVYSSTKFYIENPQGTGGIAVMNVEVVVILTYLMDFLLICNINDHGQCKYTIWLLHGLYKLTGNMWYKLLPEIKVREFFKSYVSNDQRIILWL